jgi:hypothetical protein
MAMQRAIPHRAIGLKSDSKLRMKNSPGCFSAKERGVEARKDDGKRVAGANCRADAVAFPRSRHGQQIATSDWPQAR